VTLVDEGHDRSDARLGARVRQLSENLWVVWLVLALITMVRNSLEMLGLLTASPNYCCFSPDRASFLNTFTYELLLIFGGIWIVHLVLGGSRAQLRKLVAASVAFMVPLFIFVPLVNLVLNYQGPRIPIYLLPNIYLPMGSVLGFLGISLALPLIIRRIYPDRSWARVLLGLGAGFATMFLWTYVVGFRLSFSTAAWFWEREANLMDVYSLSFMVPLVVSYPLFVRTYRGPGQRGAGWGTYGLVLLVTLGLLHTSRALGDATRLREPVVCQVVVALPGSAPLVKRLVYRKVPGANADPVHRAAFALEPGQASPVVKTPFGPAVLRRVSLPTEAEVQHIMVARQHVRWRDVPSVEVQRKLVRRRADGLRAAAANHPQAFGEMARKASDGPYAYRRGRVPMALLRPFRALYDVVAGLEKGEVSQVVPSPWGLHIFRRLP